MTPTPRPDRKDLIGLLLRYNGIPHAGEGDPYYDDAAKMVDKFLARLESPPQAPAAPSPDLLEAALEAALDAMSEAFDRWGGDEWDSEFAAFLDSIHRLRQVRALASKEADPGLLCRTCNVRVSGLRDFTAQGVHAGHDVGVPEGHPLSAPPGPAPAASETQAVFLEVEKAYAPHRADMREAMLEWVKRRTPAELIAIMRCNAAPVYPGDEFEGLPLSAMPTGSALALMASILHHWERYNTLDTLRPACADAVAHFDKFNDTWKELVAMLTTPLQGEAQIVMRIIPGDATSQDIADLMLALDGLYRAYGGKGLKFAITPASPAPKEADHG